MTLARLRLPTFLLRCAAVFFTVVLASIVLARTGLDIAISNLFYDNGWPVGRAAWAEILYKWGPQPALTLAIGGLIFGLWAALKHRRNARAAWFLVLLMLLGPGLLVNVVGKNCWGRPRPRQIIEFGGTETYRTAGHWQKPNSNRRSFSSGHASMGFSLMAGFFIWRDRRPRLARASLITGLLAGTAIGLARIAQGGHFLSDILWTAAMVYIAGELLALVWLHTQHPSTASKAPPSLAPSTASASTAYFTHSNELSALPPTRSELTTTAREKVADANSKTDISP